MAPPSPLPPRCLGALRWQKLLLQQLEAPTLQLIQEVSWGPGVTAGEGTGGAGCDPMSPHHRPPYANFKGFSVNWMPAEDEFLGWDEDF